MIKVHGFCCADAIPGGMVSQFVESIRIGA